jgi:hypothetical protein
MSERPQTRPPVWVWALTLAAAVCMFASMRLPVSNHSFDADSTFTSSPYYGLGFRDLFWYGLEVIAVPLAALALVVLNRAARVSPRFAAGAILGLGLQTTIGGIGIIGFARRSYMAVSRAGIAVLIAGLLLVAAGILWRRWLGPAGPVPTAPGIKRATAAYTCLAGAGVMLVGLLVPVSYYDRLVTAEDHYRWLTLEIFFAIAVTTAVAARTLTRKAAPAPDERALVLAVGFQSFWYFLAYAGSWTTIPQLHAHPGDYIGLLGAVVVLYGAWRLAPSASEAASFRPEPPESAPASTAA